MSSNFIDSNDNEWKGKLFTILAVNITLEAKTHVDGPYNLETTFDFSIDDPIIDHGIWRTNKPAGPNNPHATPYALTESLNRLPTLIIYKANSIDSTWVEPHRPEYQAVLAFISEYPKTAFGNHRLPPEAYEEMLERFNLDSPMTDGEQKSLDRWKEQFDVHWPNVDAFNASMESINQDRIISQEESNHICFSLDQWTAQMTAARDYVTEYERVDPETVNKNPGLGNLKKEAERALALLNQVKCK